MRRSVEVRGSRITAAIRRDNDCRCLNIRIIGDHRRTWRAVAVDNDANTAWVRDYYAALAPESKMGAYVNFLSGDDQSKIRANYGGNYDRLVSLKKKYDPGNLFHLNQNIRPEG